jgi:uncharacterized protein (TIGR03503 family)
MMFRKFICWVFFVLVVTPIALANDSHSDAEHAAEQAKSESSPSSESSSTAAPTKAEEPAPSEDDYLYEEDESEEDVPTEIENTDVVLVLDTSGSMLVTDPEKLRNEGAKLLLQFLKKGDRLGIVSFADNSTVVRPLSDYAEDQERDIYKSISNLEITGQYTNLVTGIEAAKEMLEKNHRERSSQVVVLMSDGKMEPHPRAGTPEFISRILFEFYLPELKSKGVKIHTLSFSDQADKDLLRQIAAASDAVSWFTPTADKIHESYAELFLVVKKPQIVPLTSKGFRIDADIKEVTFYINREATQGDLQLLTPTGRKVSVAEPGPGGKWFSGKKFDVITILQPEPGNWQVNGLMQNDSFATAITNLRLITDFPQKTYSGEPIIIKAQLFDGDRPIVLPEMTGDIQYGFQVTPTDKVSEPIIREFLKDDGTDGDERARDGVFSAKIVLDDEGEYKVRIVAHAPTFERNQQIPFRIRPPLLGLDIISKPAPSAVAKDGHGAAAESTHDIDWIRLKVSSDLAELRDVKIRLLAVNEKGKKFELPAGRIKGVAGQFETPTSLIPHEGHYEIKAFLSGATKKGKVVTAKSKVVGYERKELSAVEDEIELVAFKAADEKPSAPSPFPYILLITLVNGGIGAAMIKKLKASQSAVAFSLPTFRSLDGITQVIGSLETLSASAEMNFSDVRYSDPNFKFKPALGSTSQTEAGAPIEPPPADAAAPSEATPAQAAPVAEASEAAPAENGEGSTEEEKT